MVSTYPLPCLGAKTFHHQRCCCPNIRFESANGHYMDPLLDRNQIQFGIRIWLWIGAHW